MDKNSYIEKLLTLGGFPYVVWDQDENQEEGETEIPSSIYTFMSAFYQRLDYKGILENNMICQVESALGVYNLLLPGADRIYVVGPYLMERISIVEFFSCLINNNLPIMHELNLFYYSLPMFEKERIDSLRFLLDLELSVHDYSEIKQEKQLPSEDHLHSQFFVWNTAEDAFSSLISAEADLFAGFCAENKVLANEAEEKYIQKIRSLDYEFELPFLKEHLQITNCTYQRLCHMKSRQYNEIDSLFYQFHSGIEQIKNREEALALQQNIYEAYCSIVSASYDREYPYLVQQALRYINTHWKRKITLPEIAEALSVNSSYLSCVFNKATNMKITDYIHRLRADWAESLLQSTSLSIADIAFFCGYEDVSYFGKIYKKEKGETPLQARSK